MVRAEAVKNFEDLEALLTKRNWSSQPEIYLGDALVEGGVINRQHLAQALELQREQVGKHLGRILVEMGLITTEQINTALARKFHIPYVKLDDFDISPQVLSRVPAEIALQYNLLPLGKSGGRLIVAMENPLDSTGIEVLRFNTNLNIETVIAAPDDIARARSKYYSQADEDAALEDMALQAVEDVPAGEEAIHLIEQQAKKKPIVRLLNAILLQAVTRGASDINIRPEGDRIAIYYRIDGKVQFSRALPRSVLPTLVSRVKIIGQMDIAERRLPQDGHARLVRGRQAIDLRISIIPTVKGESVVIRILDKEAGMKPLERLGMNPAEVHAVKRLLNRAHGMFLVTGPTGSGKSTTLYALLNELKKRGPHILTVEDPVEYDIENIEQVQVSKVKGTTFSSVLRHFLRHDPDVIMVGEIRDQETAKLAAKASLTGHLVLSSLHTNDAASAVTRLADMGIESYLLSTTMLGVMAQRLVRLNCETCKAEVHVEPYMRRSLNLGESEKFFSGKGCMECNFTGYRGRTSVCELLVVTPEIAELIVTGKPSNVIADVAVSQGMMRLRDNALSLARTGRTSLEEVIGIALE